MRRALFCAKEAFLWPGKGRVFRLAHRFCPTGSKCGSVRFIAEEFDAERIGRCNWEDVEDAARIANSPLSETTGERYTKEVKNQAE